MTQPSFGLILANRAVVLGKVSVRDLIDLAVDRRGRGRLRHRVGGRQPARQAAAGVGHAALDAGRRDDARAARGRLHGDLRPPPSRAPRASVGEPRRALGRALVARRVPRRSRRGERGAGPRARRDVRSGERAGRAARGRHRRAARALPRAEGLPRGTLLLASRASPSSRIPSRTRARSGSRATRPASPGREARARPTRSSSGATGGSRASPTAG